MKMYSYNNGSKSAKALSAALGVSMLKHEGGVITTDTLLNWGCSDINRLVVCDEVLNIPEAVARAVNKLTAFQMLQAGGVRIPEFTTQLFEAAGWPGRGIIVVARKKLNGHSGEGIELFTPDQMADPEGFDFPIAPLYTQYIKKTQEYRLHVMHNEVFFVQRKARKLEVADEEVNWQVRNLAGGFIYANQDVELPDVAKKEAVKAIIALGLDFGAVDIIYGTDKRYYVLEVNTACGLEGTTLDKYVEQFRRFYD